MSKEMLINAGEVIPLDIFLNGKHTDILKIIKEKATIGNPSIEKATDRKIIISMAAKIASSKTFLEKIGKDLADKKRAEIDQELSTINATRNEIKTNLDELKTEVRKPVTDWENAKKAEEAEKQRIIDYDNDHVNAIAENALIDQKNEMLAENARLKKESEKRQIEDQARITAEKKVEQDRLEGLRREQEAQQKLERAELDKKIAEENRIKAEKQAVIDKQNAIDNAKKEAELKAQQAENARIAEENRVKQEKIKRENDREHSKKINNEILSALVQNGVQKDCAKSVIILIAKGLIPKIKIEY